MCFIVNVTVNAQNYEVMSVNSSRVSQIGPIVNLLDYEVLSKSTSMNTPSTGYVRGTTRVWASFGYADPVTGILTGYSHEESEIVDIYCANF